MYKIGVFTVCLLIFLSVDCKADNMTLYEDDKTLNFYSNEEIPVPLVKKILLSKFSDKNPRLVASILTIALGPFGTHRLYLGTDYKVPVFYALTLGGGLGILPLIDLIAILSVDDLEKYRNNTKFIMWME